VRRDEIADLIQRLRSPEAWTTGLRPGALPLLEEWHVDPGLLWHGVILGTAFLGAPRRSGEVAVAFGGPAADDSDRDRHANWAWPLDQVEPLDPPVPARGAQGFWEWLW
jgi:hypothetical protein